MSPAKKSSTQEQVMGLKGKVALITGAGSGIGKAIAELFASHGAVVILSGKDLDRLQTVEKQIAERNQHAKAKVMDVTDRKKVKKTIRDIIRTYAKIDILVNNAGVAKWGSILDCTYEEFDSHMLVNATGYFNCIKEVVPSMIKEKRGCIINIISSTVKNTKSARVVYAASKYAQAGISNAVHEDLKGHGINVTAIYPGKTNTPIHDLDKDDQKRKDMLQPEEVAKLAVYIATLPPTVKIKEVSITSLER